MISGQGPKDKGVQAALAERPVQVDVDWDVRKRRTRIFRSAVVGVGVLTALGYLAYSNQPWVADKVEILKNNVSYGVAVEQPVYQESVEEVPTLHALPYTEYKGESLTPGGAKYVEIFPVTDQSHFELRLKTDEGCTRMISDGNDIRGDYLDVVSLESSTDGCFDGESYRFDLEEDSEIYDKAGKTLEILVNGVGAAHKENLTFDFCKFITPLHYSCSGPVSVSTPNNSNYQDIMDDAVIVLGVPKGDLPSGVVLDLESTRLEVSYVTGKGSVEAAFSMVEDSPNLISFRYRDFEGKQVFGTVNPENKFEYYENELARSLGTQFVVGALSELEDLAIQERQRRVEAEKARLAAKAAKKQRHTEAVLEQFDSVSILGE